MGNPLTLGVLPPKQVVGTANYWQLTQQIIENLQISLTGIDHSLPLPREPHWFLDGVVQEVRSEGDGDHHIWLDYINADGSVSKGRFAAEITPQQPITPPPAGAKVRVFGILRYDFQHSWWELHPVDKIDTL